MFSKTASNVGLETRKKVLNVSNDYMKEAFHYIYFPLILSEIKAETINKSTCVVKRIVNNLTSNNDQLMWIL